MQWKEYFIDRILIFTGPSYTLKIIFCLNYFLPHQTGGTEVYVAALCEELQKLGVTTIILKPGFDKRETNEYLYNGIRVIEYPESSKNSKDLIIGKKTPSGINFFKNIIACEKPDIIHFHELGSSNGITIEHLKNAKNLNIPVFTTLHLPGYVCKTGKLKYKNKTACNGLIDVHKCAVCVLHEKGLGFGVPEILTGLGIISEKLHLPLNKLPKAIAGGLSYPKYIRRHKEVLEEIFSISNKVFVLSHWFKKLLLFNQMPEEKIILLGKAPPHQPIPARKTGIDEKKEGMTTRFVYLGRISHIKGLHVVLKAFEDIEDQNWSLDIFGQVGEKEYLSKCQNISKKKLSHIHWKGALSPSEVLPTLTNYHALIFPTIIEEMVGLVVMEAFAANIPVIGSNVRGISEQIQHGKTGILFDPENVIALRDILKKIIDNPSLLDKLVANIKAPLQFDATASHVFKVYSSVMNNEAVNLG